MRKHRDPQKAGTKELGYLDHLPLLAVLRHQLAFDLFLWQRRKHLGAISDTDCWLLHLERLRVPWPLQCSKGENGMPTQSLGSVLNCFTLPPIIIPIIMVLCGKWILPRSKACFLWNRTIFYFHWKPQPGFFSSLALGLKGLWIFVAGIPIALDFRFETLLWGLAKNFLVHEVTSERLPQRLKVGPNQRLVLMNKNESPLDMANLSKSWCFKLTLLPSLQSSDSCPSHWKLSTPELSDSWWASKSKRSCESRAQVFEITWCITSSTSCSLWVWPNPPGCHLEKEHGGYHVQ